MKIVGMLCENGQGATVTVDGGRITAVEVGEATSGTPWGGKAQVAAPGASATPGAVAEPFLGGPDVWIAPGFIDLQVNGYGGCDFNRDSWTQGNASPEAFERIVAHLWRAGTAMCCPTIVTSSHEGIVASLTALAGATDENAHLRSALPAFHVEGPYISDEDGPRGAHPREHVRNPDWDEFRKFQDAAGGRIKLLTLAPECKGALSFIEKATDTGVVVSLGHTNGTPAQIRDAVRAGARMSTHLGNGSAALLPRHENYLWQQLAEDDLTAGLIVDGHHLPPAVVKVFARVKGAERLCLVSDVVALGGCTPGLYDGGRHEVLPSGKVVLVDTPYLAGAGHLLDVCSANALRWSELGTAGVACATSENPARLLGLEARKGRIKPNFDADLTLFRMPQGHGPLEIVATLLEGEVVYSLPQANSEQCGGKEL